MCQFSAKLTTLTFSAQIPLPKKRFCVQSCENLSPDSESLLPRYHVCQFSVKTDKFDFLV